jgi:hypothetical protein
MDNVIMLKTGSPAPESLDDWKAYIAAASQVEKQAGQSLVDAIVEKGKRIAEFHAAYKAKGQKWGTRWGDVCQKTIGISEDMCRRYEAVGKNMQRDSLDILPSALESLYCLSRAIRIDQKVFDEAVVNGEINPKMTLPKARALVQRAERKSRSSSTAPKFVPRPRAGQRGIAKNPLTKEEIDPEFTGTAMDWVDKYGHVQVMTAEQYARERFSAWSANMRGVVKAAKALPELPKVDHNWLRSPRPRDVEKLAEALDYLRPMVAEAEALLARARAVLPQPAAELSQSA